MVNVCLFFEIDSLLGGEFVRLMNASAVHCIYVDTCWNGKCVEEVNIG